MPLHPSEYASMLMDKMREGNIDVWLVNTGWVGGGYGVGSRIKLKYTRAMITAALKGLELTFEKDVIFGFQRVSSCPGLDAAVLDARSQWADELAYDAAAQNLAKRFVENFKTYEAGSSEAIKLGGPVHAVLA